MAIAREYLVMETVHPVPHVKLVPCKSHEVTDLYNYTQHTCKWIILQWPDFLIIVCTAVCIIII